MQQVMLPTEGRHAVVAMYALIQAEIMRQVKVKEGHTNARSFCNNLATGIRSALAGAEEEEKSRRSRRTEQQH